MLFADEASFRQDPSLYQTWARRGHQPLIATTGQRNTQKIFGAVDLYRPGFHYQHGTVFEGSSYTQFLNRLASRYRGQEVFLIHDNAAYHKATEVRQWLSCHGHGFHLCLLPPYSPEFNAMSGIMSACRRRTTATTHPNRSLLPCWTEPYPASSVRQPRSKDTSIPLFSRMSLYLCAHV